MFELVTDSAQRESFKPQNMITYTLQRLLIPGEVSLSALAETLTELGKPVTRGQLECQSTTDILDFLVSVSSCFEGGLAWQQGNFVYGHVHLCQTRCH